jgi:hypothetical protein
MEILNNMEISADNGIWHLLGQKKGAMDKTDTARDRSVFQGIGVLAGYNGSVRSRKGQEILLLNRVQSTHFSPDFATPGMQFIC